MLPPAVRRFIASYYNKERTERDRIDLRDVLLTQYQYWIFKYLGYRQYWQICETAIRYY